MSDKKCRYFVDWEAENPLRRIKIDGLLTIRLDKPIKRKKDIEYINNSIRVNNSLPESTMIKINKLLMYTSSGTKEINIENLK